MEIRPVRTLLLINITKKIVAIDIFQMRSLTPVRSLDDDIISFLNTSPRPESFQSRLHQSVDNGWGTSEIYKNNEVALDETPDHDGDSFLEEIRQEDEGLYKLDQTLLDGSFKGTSRAPNHPVEVKFQTVRTHA